MNDEKLLRYSRQILLPQVDLEGQEILQASRVMIIGLGGIGSPVALYLAAAGVGELVICDYDKVELSNLQRQILHDEHSIGKFKVESARRRLEDMNPECVISTINEAINEKILNQYLPNINLLLDCTDNIKTRFMINKACVKHKTKLITAAAIRMEGQLSTFLNNGEGPCYQCLYTDTNVPDLSCSEAGVLATTVGIIGTLQAQEALKILLNIGTVNDGKLLLMDGMSGDWTTMKLNKRPNCPICGL
jgi:molybdopterin/thiamine biosynthesis adenylyltransferase